MVNSRMSESVIKLLDEKPRLADKDHDTKNIVNYYFIIMHTITQKTCILWKKYLESFCHATVLSLNSRGLIRARDAGARE